MAYPNNQSALANIPAYNQSQAQAMTVPTAQQQANPNVNMGNIQNAYQNILGRSVGGPGAEFYMNSGKSMEQIRKELAGSTEGEQYKQSGGQRFVDQNNQLQGINYRMPQPIAGLAGSEQALMQGLGGATDAIMQSTAQGRQDVRQGLGQAVGSIGQGIGALNPYAQTGNQAQNLQGAFSGAQGADAQAQAFANYQASPGQEWAREQGMRGLNADQALIGGSGGGNRLKEMNRYNAGVAAQNYGADFNRLGTLSDRGLQAAGGQANLYGNQAGLQSGAGTQLGNMAQTAGINIGNATLGTGNLLSSGRTQAGRDIATNLQNTSLSLADLINQQGAGISDLTGAGSAQIQGLITAAQNGDAAAQEQLASILANINQGSASNVGGAGAATTYNPAANYGQIAGGLGSIAGNWPTGGTPEPANTGSWNGNYNQY
jgi:hypothetical protein